MVYRRSSRPQEGYDVANNVEQELKYYGEGEGLINYRFTELVVDIVEG